MLREFFSSLSSSLRPPNSDGKDDALVLLLVLLHLVTIIPTATPKARAPKRKTGMKYAVLSGGCMRIVERFKVGVKDAVIALELELELELGPVVSVLLSLSEDGVGADESVSGFAESSVDESMLLAESFKI